MLLRCLSRKVNKETQPDKLLIPETLFLNTPARFKIQNFNYFGNKQLCRKEEGL